MNKNLLEEKDITSYEKSRIVGSRALQLSQGAPLRIELSEEELEEIQYNPIEIAKKEFKQGKLPIKVDRERNHPRNRKVE